jgi:hypothetical protein
VTTDAACSRLIVRSCWSCHLLNEWRIAAFCCFVVVCCGGVTLQMSLAGLQGPEAKPNRELWEYSTPPKHVASFVKAVVKHIFPASLLWGSKYNAKHIARKIDSFVLLAKTETLSLAQLSDGLRTDCLPWFSTIISSEKASLPSIRCVDVLARSLLHWLFVDFIMDLITANFYVTEVEGKQQELFYFKKKTWLDTVRAHLPLFHEQFVPVSAHFNCLFL